MNNHELRVIPKKNYLILGAVIVVTFLFIYYLYMWYDAYKEKKINMRILDNYLEVINYNELDNYLVESPEAIIYVSVLENEEIREFEKKFKKLLKSNVLDVKILYMDLTKEFKDNKIKSQLEEKYQITNKNIPLILVFSDQTVSNSYSIRENNYDVDLMKDFIEVYGKGNEANG